MRSVKDECFFFFREGESVFYQHGGVSETTVYKPFIFCAIGQIGAQLNYEAMIGLLGNIDIKIGF